MEKTTIMRTTLVLVLAGMFCMAPALAANPVLFGKTSGQTGSQDGLLPGKLSALSDARLSGSPGKDEMMNGRPSPLLPGKDLTSRSGGAVEWDPTFMYSAIRNALRISHCYL
jgi:hypothetical protein